MTETEPKLLLTQRRIWIIFSALIAGMLAFFRYKRWL